MKLPIKSKFLFPVNDQQNSIDHSSKRNHKAVNYLFLVHFLNFPDNTLKNSKKSLYAMKPPTIQQLLHAVDRETQAHEIHASLSQSQNKTNPGSSGVVNPWVGALILNVSLGRPTDRVPRLVSANLQRWIYNVVT